MLSVIFVDRIIVVAKATIHESTRNRENHFTHRLLSLAKELDRSRHFTPSA